MASSTTATQAETTVAAMVWESVGMEVTIFAVTALCALAVRSLTGGRSLPPKVVSGKPAGAAKTTAPASTKIPGAPTSTVAHRRESHPGTAAERRRPLAPSKPPPPADAATARPSPTAPGNRLSTAADPRAAARIVDEVVVGVREQQSMKFASRVLSLYTDFQAALAGPGAPTMEQVARRCRHPPADFFATVVQCAVRVGRSGLVDGIIRDMSRLKVERSLLFYEVAMKQLAGQKQYRQALAVYDHLKADGLEPSVVTCSCLIGFAAEVGEFTRAVEFFNVLSSIATPSIRAYMTVLRVHAKRQDWHASLALFGDMRQRGVKPDSLVLNFVLATGVATDQVEAAAALVEEAQREVPPIPDVVSYNTIVKGYTQRSDAEGALKVIAQMRTAGVQPNSITFNTAMDAAIRGGKVTEAWQLLEAMRAACLSPDKFTCSILVKGFLKSGGQDRVEDALSLLSEVAPSCDSTLLSTLYHAVLEAAAAAPNTQVAPQLVARAFAQMRRSRVNPSPSAQRLLVQMLPRSGGDARSAAAWDAGAAAAAEGTAMPA